MVDFEKIFNSLTDEEKLGQTFCVGVPKFETDKELEDFFTKVQPGGIFFNKKDKETIKKIVAIAKKCIKIPPLICGDVEHGAGNTIEGEPEFPNSMAWTASGDSTLIERAGEETAKICRKYGINYTFAPVVDLNVNMNCPESNIRSASDNPDAVIKYMGAFSKGLMKNGLVAPTCKHFPGQGSDDRNSHFAITPNNFSKTKWMKTYGKVYKEMIKLGVKSIMIGHSSLPAFETEKDDICGYYPAVLSKSLITGLLKEKLGFKGLVVSDAMGMLGVSTLRDDINVTSLEFLLAGGDMALFPSEKARENIINAYRDGTLSKERLRDAVKRVFILKDSVKLFDDEDMTKYLTPSKDRNEIAQKIADKSLTVLRDYYNIIPAKLKKGSKVLMVDLIEDFFHREPDKDTFKPLKDYLENKGCIVEDYIKPKYTFLRENIDKYDLVLINVKMSSRDYHGGSMRMGWDNLETLWGAYVFKNKNVIFTSFGDPYKLYEVPYIRTYVNAYSYTKESQIALAKLITGEIKAQGVCPVSLKGFFNFGDKSI